MLFHYYFNLLVFQFRVISADYFLDECSIWELNDLMDNIKYLDRNLWESSRLNSFIFAKANFKNINKIDDIFPLPWDEEEDRKNNMSKGDIEISDEDIKRWKQLQKEWAN